MAPASLFKLLGDPHRLQLVMLISHYGECCVCDLTQALGISQPKVSRLLAQLKAGELLQHQRRGRWVYYRLADVLPAYARSLIATTAAEYRHNHPHLLPSFGDNCCN